METAALRTTESTQAPAAPSVPYSTAEMRSYPLGTLVYRSGLMPLETVNRALAEAAESGRRLGEVLLEYGGSATQPVAERSTTVAVEGQAQVIVPAGVWQRTVPGPAGRQLASRAVTVSPAAFRLMADFVATRNRQLPSRPENLSFRARNE